MKNRIILCIISVLTFAHAGSSFESWINRTMNLLDSCGVEINFQSKIAAAGLEDSFSDGMLKIRGDGKFLFKLGQKVITSDGMYWRTYDSRSNQLFLHDPDEVLEENLLEIFSDRSENLSVIHSESFNNLVYLTIPGKLSMAEVWLDNDGSSPKRIIVENSEYSLELIEIFIHPLDTGDSLFNVYDVPDAFQIDLRN